MNKREKQNENTKRREAFTEIALQSGAIDRVAKLMSANYLLNSQSAVIADDIEDILASHRLQSGKVISLAKRANKALDDYFKEFSKMISNDQVQNWADDLTRFGEFFSEFSGIEKDWEPDMSKVNIEEIENKYCVKLSINHAERQ